MAKMSYCAFENTSGDMRVCLDKLSELSTIDELNEYERRAFHGLRRQCQMFLEDSELLLQEEIHE